MSTQKKQDSSVRQKSRLIKVAKETGEKRERESAFFVFSPLPRRRFRRRDSILDQTKTKRVGGEKREAKTKAQKQSETRRTTQQTTTHVVLSWPHDDFSCLRRRGEKKERTLRVTFCACGKFGDGIWVPIWVPNGISNRHKKERVLSTLRASSSSKDAIAIRAPTKEQEQEQEQEDDDETLVHDSVVSRVYVVYVVWCCVPKRRKGLRRGGVDIVGERDGVATDRRERRDRDDDDDETNNATRVRERPDHR